MRLECRLRSVNYFVSASMSSEFLFINAATKEINMFSNLPSFIRKTYDTSEPFMYNPRT